MRESIGYPSTRTKKPRSSLEQRSTQALVEERAGGVRDFPVGQPQMSMIGRSSDTDHADVHQGQGVAGAARSARNWRSRGGVPITVAFTREALTRRGSHAIGDLAGEDDRTTTAAAKRARVSEPHDHVPREEAIRGSAWNEEAVEDHPVSASKIAANVKTRPPQRTLAAPPAPPPASSPRGPRGRRSGCQMLHPE